MKIKHLLTAEQAKEADRYSISECGMPSLVLMERAALAVAEAVMERPGSRSVFVLCGTGNNGADGLAAARILSQRGCSVSVAVAGKREKATEEWERQLRLLSHLPVSVRFLTEDFEKQPFVQADIYIDALFGIGLTREVTGLYRSAIEAFNRCAAAGGAYRIAVDIPSGVCSDNGQVLGVAAECDMTVTFGWAKVGHAVFPGAALAGQLKVCDIGFFAEALHGMDLLSVCDRDLARSMLPARRKDANKGTCGRAVIIAGSPGMSGAAFLSAKAAYRSGAGLVEVLTCREAAAVLQLQLPEAIVSVIPEESRREWLARKLSRASAIAIGPGLSTNEQAVSLFTDTLAVLQKTDQRIPLVIDADGLNILAGSADRPDYENLVLTPHVGELSRLLGRPVSQLKTDMRRAARDLSEKYGALAVCKDARTWICLKNGAEFLNVTGNDGMAVGGSGDVLTGLICGLLAQGSSLDSAAILGVYLHGRAGDIAARSGRRGLIAGEIADAVRTAEEELEREENGKNSCPG